jgi:hypothetical protein
MMEQTHVNGSTPVPVITGYIPTQSVSFLMAASLAVLDAEQYGVIPETEVTILARISYLYASMSCTLDREDFLQGFKQGYADYLNGLV